MTTERMMLWALTSYFNPCASSRRRHNYRVFRESLSVPLLAVELSFDGQFELTREDADLLIQLDRGDLMWQKERLINVALDHLPAECRFVAWVDCDLVFPDPTWPGRTVEGLSRFALMQLFSELVMLGVHEDHADDAPAGAQGRYQSYVRYVADREVVSGGEVPGLVDSSEEGYAPGFAWAASRDMISQVRLFDTMILGSGDIMMAQAAYGRMDEVLKCYDLSEAHRAQYQTWGQRCYSFVRGNVGYVDQTVYHLWHGDLKDRQYSTRYLGFSRFGFDPATDLNPDAVTNCWNWNRDKPCLREHIERYFAARKEDG